MVRHIVQETRLVSGVSKVSYFLGYNYKNVRLNVSCKWFLKHRDSFELKNIQEFYAHVFIQLSDSCLAMMHCTLKLLVYIFNGPYSSFCLTTRFVGEK